MNGDIVQVGISNRHIHLSQDDADDLGINPKPHRWLGIENHYASDVIVKCGDIPIRVLLPHRNYSQVELLVSDCEKLGIYPCFRSSGDLHAAPDVEITYNGKSIQVPAIVPFPHIHASTDWMPSKESVDAILLSPRMKLMNLKIFRGKGWPTVVHIDIDEARAAGWTQLVSPHHQARIIDCR